SEATQILMFFSVCNIFPAGNIISFMTYLAPLPTFYRIYKNKLIQGFQSVPYVVALFSAMLWITTTISLIHDKLRVTFKSTVTNKLIL
ncbi:hypothetical protein EJB05_27796, partial [Eragrostis curvula]